MELHYREYGEGFPLIILHGLLGSSGNWHTLSRSVFSKTYRVFTLDLRNHGRSPHDKEMTYDAMASDVVEFASDHDLERFHLLGHSMGGKVAMSLAGSEPELVDKLIIADIAPRAYHDHHTHLFEALTGLDLETIGSRTDADKRLKDLVPSFVFRQFLLKNLAHDKEIGYYWRPNLKNIWDAYGAIAESDVSTEQGFLGETLFVRGGSSDYVTEEDEAQIASLFPKSQLSTMDNVGHWPHAEAPKEFSQIVTQFLSQ